jgi:hypothetical protein
MEAPRPLSHRRFTSQYDPELPFIDRLLRQTRELSWLMLQWARKGRRPIALLVWPEMPSRRAALYKVARSMGFELTNQLRENAVLGIRFEDKTEKLLTFNPPQKSSITWWNVACNDIRKSTLESAHMKIFGYGMGVEPTAFEGKMVVKSDENAVHDGEVIQGPLSTASLRTDAVYQVEIQNIDEKGRHFDHRVVYIKGHIPVVYIKYKQAATRFTNLTEEVILLPNSNCFSEEEKRAMGALAMELGVDYAELDVLRDANSGKLYVVDVNPTPWGPPAGLSHEQSEVAIKKMATAFAQALRESSK